MRLSSLTARLITTVRVTEAVKGACKVFDGFMCLRYNVISERVTRLLIAVVTVIHTNAAFVPAPLNFEI